MCTREECLPDVTMGTTSCVMSQSELRESMAPSRVVTGFFKIRLFEKRLIFFVPGRIITRPRSNLQKPKRKRSKFIFIRLAPIGALLFIMILLTEHIDVTERSRKLLRDVRLYLIGKL